MGKMTIQQMLIQLAGGMGTSIQIFLVTLISVSYTHLPSLPAEK